MSSAAPHWTAIVEDGQVVASGYCYCDHPGSERHPHYPGEGRPRPW